MSEGKSEDFAIVLALLLVAMACGLAWQAEQWQPVGERGRADMCAVWAAGGGR